MPNGQPFRFRTRVRLVDTDASGRIHFTAMFRYFEAAEVEFLRTLGVTYDVDSSFNFPRVHVECDFLKVISNDDLIDIEVSVTNLGRSSVRFEFRTFKGTEVAAKTSSSRCRLCKLGLPFSPTQLGLAPGQFPRSAPTLGGSSPSGFRFPARLPAFAFLQFHKTIWSGPSEKQPSLGLRAAPFAPGRPNRSGQESDKGPLQNGRL